ncbi:MAG: HEAT repeat domain-containing protein [Candidatus Omnitrophica bacterium]|nr:HEAT repeat domain-containing protein [Candidatus Omnitrophota bacterium]
MSELKRSNSIRLIYFITFVFILSMISTSGMAAPSLKALIVDGQNNHDWQATTPVLKEILEECGLFSVDVATSPEQGKPMDSFKPEFSAYNVIVLNYTGDDWPVDAQKAFVDYVQNGGGVVVFHAANNAFPNWKEFNEIIGLGGWGGRDEKSGPMVRYRGGKMTLDNSPGAGGTHGAQREYEVVIRDKEHPITKGLPEVWMHAKDELYANLRGPAKNLHILATSPSKVTKENEPALFTIQYGKGRIFHDVLGHGPYAMSCAGFAFTLQRGAEWAATGQVTLNEIPANFPVSYEARFRLRPISLESIKAYKFGESRKALSDVEENIRNAAPSQRKQIEGKMIEVLNADDATFEAKQFACRMLRRIGTDACLPILERLLRDESLSNMARFALQGMSSESVNGLLRKALSGLDGDLRIGVIGTLAQRGDQEAAAQIAPLLGSEDPLLAEAAIKALGEIGGRESAQALSQATAAESLQFLKDDSLLLCLDRWAAEGGAEQAASFYEQMTGEEKPIMTRITAYRGMIQCNPENSIPLLISLLKKEELALRQAAAGPFLRLIPGSKVVQALAEALPQLTAETQIMTIAALAARGDASAAPAMAQAASSENEAVKIAAIEALGVLGDASHVEMLAGTAAQGGAAGAAAFQSLAKLKGADGAILKALQTSVPEIQAVLIQTITDRRSKGAMPLLLAFALNENDAIQREAVEGLTRLSKPENIPGLLLLLSKTEDPKGAQAIEQCVVSVAGKMEDPNLRTQYFMDAMKNSPAPARAAILQLLGRFGGQSAFEAVQKTMAIDYDATVKKAALSTLMNWPDASPIETVYYYAKNETELCDQQEALKSYLRMINLISGASNEQTIERFKSAMQIAKDKDDQILVIEAVSQRANAAVLAFLEQQLGDPLLERAALKGYQKVVKQMETTDVQRDAWKLSASNNPGGVKNAVDGNKATRWDTGASQRPGMWFQIDLGAECVVEEITLDATGSNADYPRKYQVLLSFDGQNFGAPAAEGVGDGPVTVIKIPSQNARFVRIVQTGSVDGLFWSIHELTMKVSSDQKQLEHAYEVLKRYEK